jgi:hypothetical protein
MSALMVPKLSLSQVLHAEHENSADPNDQCRFCGCTDSEPCGVLFVEDDLGIFRLARNEDECTVVIPCTWYVPRVCNSPECVEKLLLEKRSRPILFEASGRRVNG